MQAILSSALVNFSLSFHVEQHHIALSYLSVQRKKAATDTDNAATELVKLKGNMASMRGEMSQMVAERPNAGAVRHQNRRCVIRGPRRQDFVPVAAHGITPIDVASGA